MNPIPSLPRINPIKVSLNLHCSINNTSFLRIMQCTSTKIPTAIIHPILLHLSITLMNYHLRKSFVRIVSIKVYVDHKNSVFVKISSYRLNRSSPAEFDDHRFGFVLLSSSAYLQRKLIDHLVVEFDWRKCSIDEHTTVVFVINHH